MGSENPLPSMALLLMLLVYFAPTAVASMRKHINRSAIAALNLLLGWTVLGWIAALVWALTANTETDIRTG